MIGLCHGFIGCFCLTDEFGVVSVVIVDLSTLGVFVGIFLSILDTLEVIESKDCTYCR